MNLQYFSYSHLPENLQTISRPFGTLAHKIDRMIKKGEIEAEEGNVAMRKLLEAKDAAVRAALNNERKNP